MASNPRKSTATATPPKLRAKRPAPKAKPQKNVTTARAGRLRAAVRMYRLGVGDCFLVRFRNDKETVFSMVIDCGVYQTQPGGAESTRRVVEDIAAVTGKRLDALVVTHEHWDHLAGFLHAKELWRSFTVDEVWSAWTEDEQDKLAQSLLEGRRRALRVVGAAAQQLVGLLGPAAEGRSLAALTGFFGDTTGERLAAAGEVVRDLANRGNGVRYLRPDGEPIELPGGMARVFVLGPPRDQAAIRDLEGKGNGHTYGFGMDVAAFDQLEASFTSSARTPFDDRFSIPLATTHSLDFFQRHYWSDRIPETPAKREEATQRWRRIDLEWLEAPHALALALDNTTNNTSLVLAIELGPPQEDGPVLLFAADAQIGNWLSWKKVAWDYHGRRVTGSDLLSRAVLYKVGHHGSHNATLREGGLEVMKNLRYALVPTDQAMASKVRWGNFPCQALLERLAQVARTVVRTDRDVKQRELYWEVEL
ncbi:MAG: MBL fold metallo-hydrolase [Polyangiaceae bacterium]|nr:MBL fold metallo-hydrolase [Polyangiaceae bacterium]